MAQSQEERWTEALTALDGILYPIAHRRVDISDPAWSEKLRAMRPLDEAGIRLEAEALLQELVDAYAVGDEARRGTIRGYFRTFGAFAWAATLRLPCTTPEGFRARLLHFSILDQGQDPRDATMSLDALVDDARRAGVVAVDDVLKEVADLSSREDRYKWGPTRDWLLKRLAPPARTPMRRRDK